MDRINDPSAEADKHGAGKDGWTDGTATDPGSGTVIRENWMDGVQEELLNVIETAGITPLELTFTQLLEALQKLFVEYTDADSTIDFNGMPNDQTPMVKSSDLPSATYKLINEYRTKTNDTARLYVNTLNQFWVLFNATSDGTNFTKDASASADPVAIVLSGFSSNPTFGLYKWTGSAFAATVSLGTDAPATPSNDTLYPQNVPKAWVRCGITTSTATITDSFNVNATAVRNLTTERIEFTLLNGMANSTYCVMLGGDAQGPAIMESFVVSPTRFDVGWQDPSTGGPIDIATSPVIGTINVVIFGDQT